MFCKKCGNYIAGTADLCEECAKEEQAEKQTNDSEGVVLFDDSEKEVSTAPIITEEVVAPVTNTEVNYERNESFNVAHATVNVEPQPVNDNSESSVFAPYTATEEKTETEGEVVAVPKSKKTKGMVVGIVGMIIGVVGLIVFSIAYGAFIATKLVTEGELEKFVSLCTPYVIGGWIGVALTLPSIIMGIVGIKGYKKNQKATGIRNIPSLITGIVSLAIGIISLITGVAFALDMHFGIAEAVTFIAGL